MLDIRLMLDHAPCCVVWKGYAPYEGVVSVDDSALEGGWMLLKLDEEIMARAMATADADPVSRHSTVSFLGATTAGKSILINSLLRRLTGDNSVTGPRVRTAKQTGPTTSGASFYRLQQPESTLILMDCDGQGGNCPQQEQRATRDTNNREWREARRRVTKQDLRRLGYVSSHVMVYVSENGFANHERAMLWDSDISGVDGILMSMGIVSGSVCPTAMWC